MNLDAFFIGGAEVNETFTLFSPMHTYGHSLTITVRTQF